jgi:hypothetical protein
MSDRGDAHRFRLLLKAIRDAITTAGYATSETIREYAKTKQEEQKPRPAEPPSRITVDVQIPRAETDRYYTEQQKSHRLQWWTFWATIATFVAVAAYAVITYFQWRTMDATYKEVAKQTNSAEIASKAAKLAADTAANQFTLTKQVMEGTYGARVVPSF